jgi:hypothetical protein
MLRPTPQAAHKVLTEEHSSLLNRQVGTASQRTSLRQELLTLEEQYLGAKAQVLALLLTMWSAIKVCGEWKQAMPGAAQC